MAPGGICRYDAPAMTPEKRSRALATVALTLGAASAVFPVVALPALFATMMAALLLEKRARLLGGLLGGLLATFGFVRFVVDWVAPNIVAAGRHSAEEKAVSRLREILWAQERALQLGLVRDDLGQPRAATLDELTSVPAPGGAPLLRPDLFVPAGDDVRKVEGYLFEAHPAPTPGTRRRWIAYAWPAEGRGGGRRAFFIDSDDRICETPNDDGYVAAQAPTPTAALQAPRFDAPACGKASDGAVWTAWKDKAPRGEVR